MPKIILSDGMRFFQIFLPYLPTDTSRYNSQQGKVAHSIQEFPLLKINKVSDILRNVKEIKDRVVIIPKHITENKKGGIMVVKRALLFYLDPGCYALAFPQILLW